MPNTDAERLRFKAALTLIANRYQTWISGTQQVGAILGASVSEFDRMVKFMDEGPFLTNLHVSGRPKTNCTYLGFTDYLSKPPTIYINRAKAPASTLVHELLHFLTHPTFSKLAPPDLNEGITEYFTRKTQGSASSEKYGEFKPKRQSYDLEVAAVDARRAEIRNSVVPNIAVLRKSSPSLDPFRGTEAKDIVKRAYFRGELAMIMLLKERVTVDLIANL